LDKITLFPLSSKDDIDILIIGIKNNGVSILFVPVRDPLIFQFLKLVRIFFVFPNNMYIVYVYIH
jgi:hypothetical protein